MDKEEPVFLGGMRVAQRRVDGKAVLEQLQEVRLGDLAGQRQVHATLEDIADREWTAVVVAVEGTFQPNFLFVILGGVIILAASLLLAGWVYGNAKRVARYNAMKAESEAEKVALVLENTRKAADAERELNDFIAHEVRNPVSAAMSACSFVKAAVNKSDPLATDEARKCVREDVDVIDRSLQFVYDLLRNMLDMHRAVKDQIVLQMRPTDILQDILEPVDSMLYRRGVSFEVQVEWNPRSLIVSTDPVRLKQVLLNLSRNSSTFVSRGFIRLRAAVVNGRVQLSVEDSGPGIPPQKQDQLFCKFQESLDRLNQGTVSHATHHELCRSVILNAMFRVSAFSFARSLLI